MVSATEIINRLKGEGWCLSQESVEEWINGSGGSLTMHQAQQDILNSDIKDIGAPCLPTEIQKANHVNGPLVVQVSKVRNISAPKAFQESGGAPRMLGVTFTDGTNSCTGIEMQNIKAISLKLAPGTKVKLSGKINVNNGYLILTSQNMSVIGGMVEDLYNKWKLAITVGKYSVRGVLDGSGPPPWVPFGKRINKNFEELTKFKALKDPQVKEEEEDEFESQRKQTVQELAKEGNNKVFGGGKQMMDANLQKVVNAGFSPEVAIWALRNNKNNPGKAIQELKGAQNPSYNVNRNRDRDEDEASSFGRGGRGRGRGRGRNKVEGPDGSDDELPPPNMPRPSGPASLFDFLDTKMISKNETVKFVEPVPDVTGKSSRGRGRGERGYGRGGRGNHRDRGRGNTNNATYNNPTPNLLTENWPAPGEDRNPPQSNRGYFESKEMMEELERKENIPHPKSSENSGRAVHQENRQQYDHPSRNTASAGRDKHRDSHSEFRKDLMAGSFETNYDGVQKNNYQTNYDGVQKSNYQTNYGVQKNNYQTNYDGVQKNNYQTIPQKSYYTNQSDSYQNSRGRGQRNFHNSNEKEQNRVSGNQRGGYNSGQWNDSSSNYTSDPKDTYYNSQRSVTTGANRGQMKNGDGKYVEKSYPQHSENVGRGNGNSRQQKVGSGNGGYRSQQYYQEYSDKSSNYSAEPSHTNSQYHNSNMYSDGMGYNNTKGSGGGYSSPRFQQSRGAAHVGGHGSAGERTEKEIDLIQQFQQSMLLQGHYTPEDVNAINAKLLMSKSKKSDNERKSLNLEDISNVNRISDKSLQIKLQQRVRDIVGYNRYPGFPGSLPIDLNHKTLSKLRNFPHKVSWKADGTRYMMLIEGAQEIYLIGTNLQNTFHIPRLEFRQKNNLTKHTSDTLLDGELIIDINPRSGVKVTRFLIFDAISVEGRHVASENFHRRHEIIETDIINPRNIAINQGLLYTKQEPFTVQQKMFWNVSPQTVGQLLSNNFLDQVGHGTDGLIFQRVDGPYAPGVTDTILKFKPIALTSIDFRLKVVHYKGGKYGELYVVNSHEPFGDIEITKEIDNLHNKIIECSYTETGWLFLRQRTDRSYPNNYDTALAIWETICNPLKENYLLNYIQMNCKK